MTVEKIIEYLKKTNPEITKDKLLKELKQYPYFIKFLNNEIQSIDKRNI